MSCCSFPVHRYPMPQTQIVTVVRGKVRSAKFGTNLCFVSFTSCLLPHRLLFLGCQTSCSGSCFVHLRVHLANLWFLKHCTSLFPTAHFPGLAVSLACHSDSSAAAICCTFNIILNEVSASQQGVWNTASKYHCNSLRSALGVR